MPRALLARLARPIDDLTETIPCTMVFADVSGFTRLSERLARRGKEGAEQLVDVINACFSALLAEAYGRGGSLVKFGGDAMVLLFYDQEGNQEHAPRACCAAAAMRRTLREVGRVRAGDSNVVLRMSVGVHSGAYAMFVVGGSHRELADRRPGDERRSSRWREPRPRADPDQPGDRPDGCLAAASAREVRPRRPARPLAVAVRVGAPGSACPTPSRGGRSRASCPPRSEPISERVDGSRASDRDVAFLQFGGLDRGACASRGPRPRRARLDRASSASSRRRSIATTCAFLDSDIASDGGKIRLSAGAPRVVGDDEERMLLALRHIVEAGPPLPVTVGVNRGPVFTGQVGPDYRRWYAVMGDTVNLAARLMAKAPAGRIYATRDVLRGAKTSFEQTALEPFAVKGKTRPVQAWDVGPTGPRRLRAERSAWSCRWSGAKPELDQLRSADRAARDEARER